MKTRVAIHWPPLMLPPINLWNAPRAVDKAVGQLNLNEPDSLDREAKFTQEMNDMRIKEIRNKDSKIDTRNQNRLRWSFGDVMETVGVGVMLNSGINVSNWSAIYEQINNTNSHRAD